MLTLKLITEETERVIAGLEKKNFKGAREAIDNVIAVDISIDSTDRTGHDELHGAWTHSTLNERHLSILNEDVSK